MLLENCLEREARRGGAVEVEVEVEVVEEVGVEVVVEIVLEASVLFTTA